jgi:hypothetical protein
MFIKNIMKSSKIIIVAILLFSGQLLNGQQPKNQWEKWNILIGEWIGEGTGQPGQNEGKFSFQTDLDGKILIRKNHSAFPETTKSKAMIHDDLLIVYPGTASGTQESIYFDNEGNIIKYKVSFTENSIILTSDVTSNAPRFRLSYIFIDKKTVNITFEMTSPQAPDDFKMYLEGKAYKVK